MSDPKYYPNLHEDDGPEEEESYDNHHLEDQHPGFNYFDSEDDIELTRDSNKILVKEEAHGVADTC